MNKTIPTDIVKSARTENQEPEIELQLKDLIFGVIKFWWLCLALALLGAAVVFINNFLFFTPIYESSATFTVQTQESGSSSGVGITSYSFSYNRNTAIQLSQAFPYIIESNILQDIILNDLEISEMPASLSANSVSDTNMFTITASGQDPQLTYDVIISTMNNYPAVAEYVIGNTNLTLLNEPVIPTEPININNYKQNMIIGALVGLMLSAVWIVLYILFRQTIRSRHEVREKLNQHCIGVLPQVIFKKYKTKINQSILLNNPKVGDSYLESFRALRNSILHKLADDQKVIMVTSTAPGEGKSTVSTNLAISLGKMEKNVLLIDADLRNPSINRLLDIDIKPDTNRTHPAKIDLLTEFGISVLNFNTVDFDLWKIMRVDCMQSLFNQLRETYDYIIVDTPPLGLTSDPSIIAQACDTAILVIREDMVRVSRITSAINTLLYSDVNLVGCILNGTNTGFLNYSGNYGYNYGRYGYGYGYGERKSRRSSDKQENETGVTV